MIPRILHQTWKSTRVPRAFRAYVASWRQHQQLDQRLYSDEHLRDLVACHFPQHLSLYDQFTRNLERVDFARYALMHIYGGIYADLDMECLRSLEPLLSADGPIIGIEPAEHTVLYQTDQVLCNAILFSPRQHPLWRQLLDYIADNYRPHGNAVYNTGPMALTACYRDCPQWFHDTQILSAGALYPQVDKRFGGKRDGSFPNVSWECRMQDAYTTHHWAHTNDTLLDSLKTSLVNGLRGLRKYYRETDDGQFDRRFYRGALAAQQRRASLLAALAELAALMRPSRIDLWLMDHALLRSCQGDATIDGNHGVELGVHYNHLFLMRTMRSSHPRYVLDVNPNHVTRERQWTNQVDARFVDKETGVFIDILGYHTTRNAEYVANKRADKFLKRDIYPLSPCLLEGIATLRPNNPRAVLGQQVGSAGEIDLAPEQLPIATAQDLAV